MRAALALFAAVAAFAPLLANDVPLVARAGGGLRFPALVSYLRDPGPAPDGQAWKAWWAGLPAAAGEDFAIMPPWPFGPDEVDAGPALERPSAAHPLGVDDVGRDLLARLLHGARRALLVAVGVVALGLSIGFVAGGFAGLGGRLADFAALRLIEVFTCFPGLLAVLAVAAFVGGSLATIVLVLGLVSWTAFARVVRGELLSLRERPFVLAARGLGAGPLRLLFRHLMPQLRGPLLVTAAFVAAEAILVESTLTFLGLGAGLDSSSWGALLDQGRAHAAEGAWHLWVFPGAAVALVVVALHALGDRGRLRGGAVRPPSAHS
jgi:peptide/nickel transport system permease protein